MTKKGLLYKRGMRIAMSSRKDGGQRWFRGGEEIEYAANRSCAGKTTHVLSFSYEFLHDNDTVSMAFAEPYTTSDLKKDLNKISRGIGRKCIFNREALCTTVGGAACEVITLTSTKLSKEPKKAVIVTARVHPGETVGSWMMKGVLEFLASKNCIAQTLLDKYVFKVVPCLNPDGVVQGNYRCSLSGCDLNRKYISPSSVLHPAIYCLKGMIKRLGIPVAFYFDLHGHSKKKDVFAYGNTSEVSPEDYRLFPFVLSKLNNLFSYKSSKFSVNKSKASTARVAMWRELKIPTVYTIEASFYGATGTNEHFTPWDLVEMGHSLCQALLVHAEIRGNCEDLKVNPAVRKVAAEVRREFAAGEKALAEASDSGSDSSPAENEGDLSEIIREISRGEDMRRASGREGDEFERLLINLQSEAQVSKSEDKKERVVSNARALNERILVKGQVSDKRSPKPFKIEASKVKQNNKSLLKVVPIYFSTRNNQASRNKPDGLHSSFDGSSLWKASSYNRYFINHNLRYKRDIGLYLLKLKQDPYSTTQEFRSHAASKDHSAKNYAPKTPFVLFSHNT